MSALTAILFGLVQGVTEFLPVSSSGHLVLLNAWLGVPYPGVFTAVALHLATALALLVLLRRDAIRILSGFCRALFTRRPGRWETEGAREGVRVLISSAVLLAVVPFSGRIEPLFDRPRTAGVGLIITAALLLGLRWLPRGKGRDGLSFLDAFWIGMAQAIAVLPGLSRSGSTIAAGTAAGASAERAARYSLLIAVPAIFGSAVWGWIGPVRNAGGLAGTFSPMPILIGMVFAFFSGWGAARLLIHFAGRRRLWWFAPYCFLLGLGALILFH